MVTIISGIALLLITLAAFSLFRQYEVTSHLQQRGFTRILE